MHTVRDNSGDDDDVDATYARSGQFLGQYMTKDTFAAAHATLLICLLRLSDLMTLKILLVIAKMMEQNCCFL